MFRSMIPNSQNHMYVVHIEIELKLMLWKHTSGMQEHLAHGFGVLNTRVSMDSQRLGLANNNSVVPQDEDFSYLPVPQTPSPDTSECTVTVNFPDMLLVGSASAKHPPAYPSVRQEQEQQVEHDVDVSVSDWGLLPEKLQPPPFRVHRCHHQGIEPGGEGDEFQLPNGFPEAVQHICQIPDHVSRSSLTEEIF